MENLTNHPLVDEIKATISKLLKQKGFDDIQIEGIGGGGNDRVDNLQLTINARNSRGKKKIFNK